MKTEPIPKSLQNRKGERPFFDVDKMPPIENLYVCWLDLMGANSIMSIKMSTSSRSLTAFT